MKYKDWLKEWLEIYIQPMKKSRTYDRYSKIVYLHIVPNLGEFELSEISTLLLQRHLTRLLENGNKRTGKGLSASFVKCIISILQNSLRTANILGLTDNYVLDKIKRPKVVEKQVECFTIEEQKKIENYIAKSNKTRLKGIVLCLYTGLRIGELLALTWSDVDFVRRKLFVTKTCYDGNIDGVHCVIMDTPKTEHSRRCIPLSKPITNMLKEMKRVSKSDFVIECNAKQVFVRSYQRTFELLLKKLKLGHKGFHALRHTFATRAIECGMDVKSLAEILGHKNAMITINRYAHSLWEHKAEMMNKLGKML